MAGKLDAKTLKEYADKLKQIEKYSRDFKKNINTTNLKPVEENAGAIDAIFERMNNHLEEMGDNTDFLTSSFQQLVGEIKNSNSGLNNTAKSLRGLASISDKLSESQKGRNNLSSKELKKLQEKSQAEAKRLSNSKVTLKLEADELSYKIQQLEGIKRKSNEEKKQLTQYQKSLAKNLTTQNSISDLLSGDNSTLNSLNNELSREVELTKQVEKNLGLAGAAMGGIESLLSKMGFGRLGSALGVDQAKKDMSDLAKTMAKSVQRQNDLEASVKKQAIVEAEIKKLNKGGLTDKQALIGVGGKNLKNLVLQRQQLKNINKLNQQELKDLKKKNIANRGIAAKVKTTGKGMMSMTKNLMSSLSDPAVLFSGLIGGFKMLMELGFKFDKQVGQIGKAFGVSDTKAKAMRASMADIQATSDNVYMTIKNQVAATEELASAFGTTSGLSEQMVEDQVMLTKQMNLSGEAAAGFQTLSKTSGESVDSMIDSILDQTVALENQTGIHLNNKDVIESVAKVGGQLKAQYQNNPKLIAAAVIQAKRLGIEMEHAKKMSESMLDFESSLEKELTAELLTGKNLNLERARGLALQGKSVEAAAAMLEEVGSLEEFMAMNPIQQKALADAVGMTVDELANSMTYQKNLNKLGKDKKKQIEEQVARLKAAGKTEEANALMASTANKDDAEAALKRISAQDKFNVGIEKLQAMLGEIMAGPAMGIAEWIGKLVSDTDRLRGLFDAVMLTIKAMAYMKLAGLIGQLTAAAIQAGLLGAGAATAASGLTLGLAAIGIVAGIAAISAAMGAFGDDVVMPGNKSGYGKRTLFGPEGAIQLNNKDTVIAGTNLFGDDTMSEPGKPTSMAGKGEIKVKTDKKPTSNNETNTLLRELISKVDSKGSVVVNLGPNKVGEALYQAGWKMIPPFSIGMGS